MSTFYNNDNNTIDNFYDKDYSEIDNRSEIIEDVLKVNTRGTSLENKNDDKTKLTHKDCLLLYLNPNIGSKNKLELSMKHVRSCDICKKELAKAKAVDNISVSSDKLKSIKKNSDKTSDKSNDKTNDKMSSKSNEKIVQPFVNIAPQQIDKNDDYKKMLLDEKNIQYQNILIENTMSKFLENNDEKKKLNENIEKILQYLLKKDIQESSSFKYSVNDNQNSKNDFTIIYICLAILIILIIIDIVLRLK